MNIMKKLCGVLAAIGLFASQAQAISPLQSAQGGTGSGTINYVLLSSANAASGYAKLDTNALVPCALQPIFSGDISNSAGSCVVALAASGVSAGSYTNANITVDAKGRVTAASNGSGGTTGGTAGVTSFGPSGNTRTGVVVPATGDYTVAQVTGAAPLDSPTFTTVANAPTPTTADNSTKIATTAWANLQGYLTATTQAFISSAKSAFAFVTGIAINNAAPITNTQISDEILITQPVGTNTTLSAAISSTSSGITISVASTATYTNPILVRVDAEDMVLAVASGTTFTATTRGALGSTAAVHSSGATVYPIQMAILSAAGITAVPGFQDWNNRFGFSCAAPLYAIQICSGQVVTAQGTVAAPAIGLNAAATGLYSATSNADVSIAVAGANAATFSATTASLPKGFTAPLSLQSSTATTATGGTLSVTFGTTFTSTASPAVTLTPVSTSTTVGTLCQDATFTGSAGAWTGFTASCFVSTSNPGLNATVVAAASGVVVNWIATAKTQ